jgi:alkanesulfonate monooxygenase SsuD/methylene tetrahydromethanopterin reductase-like flavin-dependent oxidoreductase (luciferase family)
VSPVRRPLEFGVSVIPTAADLDASRAVVRAAEEGGLDLVGIQDHPYQPRFLDTWFLIATLLAETRRLRFFPDVANLPLRHPAMMAKGAATLDVLSGGRFELGLGAGASADRAATMGGPKWSRGESVDALEEAIEILRRAWSGEEEVTFEGRHYRVEGFEPGPPPAHRIEIWIGAYGPRMLRLTGRLADGWIPSMGYLPPDELGARSEAVDGAAREAGRDPAEVRHAYNISGAITDGERGGGPLDGPPDHWAETLAGWADRLSVDTFVLWPRGDDLAGQVERFADEVVPAVRRAAQ